MGGASEGPVGGSEEPLLVRLRRGDRPALDMALRTHWNDVVRFARGLGLSPDQAEDVAQDTFLRLWENRARWRTDLIKPILYRVARNLSLNTIRDRDLRRGLLARRRSDVPLPWSAPSGDPAVAREVRDAVRAAIDTLSPRRKEVFLLARFHGLTYAEIADVMDLATQTVANHMSAAQAQLRESLGHLVDDELARGDSPPLAWPAAPEA